MQPRLFFQEALKLTNWHFRRPVTVEDVVNWYRRCYPARMQALLRNGFLTSPVWEDLQDVLLSKEPFDRTCYPRLWFYVAGVYESALNVLCLKKWGADRDHFLHVHSGVMVPRGFWVHEAGAMASDKLRRLRVYVRTGVIPAGRNTISEEWAQQVLKCFESPEEALCTTRSPLRMTS